MNGTGITDSSAVKFYFLMLKAKPWTFDSVYIKGNQMKMFQ